MSRFDWIEPGGSAAPQPTPPQDANPPSKDQSRLCHSRPTDAAQYSRAAREKRLAGHFAEAAELYNRSLSLDEHQHHTWVLLIDSLVRAEALADAERVSRDAVQNYGQVYPFYAARAYALAAMGHLDEATYLSDTSLQDPGPAWYARCVRADLLLRQGAKNRSAALQLLEQALDKTDDPWEVYFIGGTSLFEAALLTYAASFFAEAAHFAPTSSMSWLLLGDAFRGLRLYDQAMFYYDRAAEIAPDDDRILKRQRDVKSRAYGLLQGLLPVEMRDRWRELSEE